MTFQIACIGEPLAEISGTGAEYRVGFGGDTLNTAIYCARSSKAAEISVQYVTAIGHDALSHGLLKLLEEEGISTKYVTHNPSRQIGLYSIQNDDQGERSFHYWRDSSAARRMFETDQSPHLAAIEHADLVYLSGISVAILAPDARNRLWAALAARRKNGMQVAFDSNFRPQLWESLKSAQFEIARFWQITDIALPSSDDEATLFGAPSPTKIIDRIHAAGASKGALKCGSNGPISIQTRDAQQEFPPATNVVDTTGAGDSFNGAYLAAFATGIPEEEALALAHDLAARVVGHKGAILPKTKPLEPQRMGTVIRLKPQHLKEYKRLHADVWPEVLQRLRASNITNYSIFLKEPECLMFGYWDYTGTDFAADDAAIAADPATQRWWAVCGPMQQPFECRAEGEWWAYMEEVFHLD